MFLLGKTLKALISFFCHKILINSVKLDIRIFTSLDECLDIEADRMSSRSGYRSSPDIEYPDTKSSGLVKHVFDASISGYPETWLPLNISLIYLLKVKKKYVWEINSGTNLVNMAHVLGIEADCQISLLYNILVY